MLYYVVCDAMYSDLNFQLFRIILSWCLGYFGIWQVRIVSKNYDWHGIMVEILSTYLHIVPLEEQCHNSKKHWFELCPQEEVCLRPYLPSGIASHVCFLKWPQEGRSVILLMLLHHPGQWFFLSPEKLYFFSCDSVLLWVRYVSDGLWSQSVL
jgi:hypothetical protein